MKRPIPPGASGSALGLLTGLALALGATSATAAITCARTVTADVVTIDMPILNSRLGASNVNGMMYALRGDVVPINSSAGGIDALISTTQQVTDELGNVTTVTTQRRNAKLRDDKRPRPLVLRVAAGDCLDVNFQNLVAPAPNPLNAPVDRDGIGNDPNPVTADGTPQITVFVDEQVLDRRTAFHANGMQLRAAGGILNDGSFVGRNPSSLMAPGQSTTYRLFAEREQVFQVVSHGALVGSDANQGNTANGLFGQVIVEPRGARTYRNTVTDEDMRLATRTGTRVSASCPKLGAVKPGTTTRYCETLQGHPVLNYEATYPNTAPWTAEGKAGRTILNMIQNNVIVHTEVDAVIVGPNADGTFPASTYPLESIGKRNPAYPNRLEPFRDFAQLWHDEVGTAQAYPGFYNTAGFRPPAGQEVDPLTTVFAYLLKGVRDKFMINYASGGIGTEILSNRLGVGPMYDCLNCAYEEFFLTTFTVGDVGQLVDIPANAGLETITPQNVLNILLFLKTGAPALTQAEADFVAAMGPKANQVFYPEDPANVNHSYVGDFIKFRNTHNGFEQHVFHLHNHQWLFNANDDNANYIDAQGIGPGMGYTYEIANGGSGNRNKSAGDAIFHCHFYPHFAQGMWYMWRIHDVLETGTRLQASGADFHTVPFALKSGKPAAGSRAQPDGEILAGAPIPAVVPLPGKPLPPMPAAGVTVVTVDRDGNGKPDSSQAQLPFATIAGPDGKFGTADDKNPGFPFWIAGISCGLNDPNCDQGIVGQRPSTPPMDMMTKAEAQALVNSTQEPFASMSVAMKSNFVSLAGDYEQMHGGLPRHALHGVKAGGIAAPTIAGIVSPVDLTKIVARAKPVYFPEGGTEVERTAMWFHSQLNVPSFSVLPSGTVRAGNFVLNGQPPVPGAVFSDGCRDDAGNAIASNGTNTWTGGATLTQRLNLPSGQFGSYTPRIYKGANIQYDAVLNKVGYHNPQQRIVSLWEDVLPVIEKNRPGEPLVMRLNTFDCAMYHHTNLIPETYEMDDYQLRTPTDIIGQHIHLPKWDLTTTDGAANGWNYEDGTLSYGAVRERIEAINCYNGHAEACHFGAPVGPGTDPALHPAKHSYFPATGPGGVDWTGARTTLQRWFADPLLNTQGVDRGLGIIFTHDHYGPSTFQQIGLYSTVLVEPARSTWAHSETGNQLGCRSPAEFPALVPTDLGQPNTDQSGACRNDGGPTSFQAAIMTGDLDADGKNDSFREFYIEYTDFQHAYEAGVYVGAGTYGEPNGSFDEKAYLGFAPALQGLFYPEIHHAPADGLFPAFADGATQSDTFRFAIAPPLTKTVKPIFPDLTVEKAVTMANGALSAPAVVGGEPNNVRECIQRPCPLSIDFLEPGMFVANYRNEPVALRVYDPNKPGPDALPGKDCSPLNPDRTGCGAQADGLAGDLSYALSSDVLRAIPELNVMPAGGTAAKAPVEVSILPAANIATTVFPPHINISGFSGGDPFTPMLRTYSGDRVRIKAQAGGDEEEHSISVNGMKWLQGGSGFGRAPNSGWKNQTSGGISEQFNLASPVFMDFGQRGGVADYLYMMDATQDGFWNGDWGLIRNYNTLRTDLFALPNNVRPVQPLNRFAFQSGARSVCPNGAPLKTFNITAVSANLALAAVPGVTITPNGNAVLEAGTPNLERDQLPAGVAISSLHAGGPLTGDGTLVFNARTSTVQGTAQHITVDERGPLHDPTGMMYVLTSDLDADGKLRPGVPVEPFVMRVNAGDCVQVTLNNRLPELAPDLPNYNALRAAAKRNRLHPEGSTTFQNNAIRPSSHAGFHTQFMEYDVTSSDGMNVGSNPVQTVAPGGAARTYTYYAGDLALAEIPQIGDANRFNFDVVRATAVEFGPSNILPADRVKQPQKGLFGTTVVMPRGATVSFPDPTTRSTVDVRAPALAQVTNNFGFNTLPVTTAQTYRDFAVNWAKMLNYRYASGNAVQNESEEGPGVPENPPHTALNAVNYRAEPTFFRFGIPPLSAAGNAGCGAPVTAPFAGPATQNTCFGSVQNSGDLFSNTLTAGADPQVPVFKARPGQPIRMGVVMANSSNRAATFILHGHVWPRDPYLALRRDAAGFPTNANIDNVGSVVIGDNPMQQYFGAQESIIGSASYLIKPNNGAGGADAVPGDYLFRDTAAAGMGHGAWGILRVE
jgi:manganese oxidase